MKPEEIDLQEICSRLEALAKREPSDAVRRELEEGLLSKWEGVQVVSARSLAAWGDKKALKAIKAALVSISRKPTRWSAAGAIAKTLSGKLGEKDVEWVVQLCLVDANRHNRFALNSLLCKLPKDAALKALHAREGKPHVDPKELRHARIIVGRRSETRKP